MSIRVNGNDHDVDIYDVNGIMSYVPEGELREQTDDFKERVRKTLMLFADRLDEIKCERQRFVDIGETKDETVLADIEQSIFRWGEKMTISFNQIIPKLHAFLNELVIE